MHKMPERDLVLVGGGHAHALVIRMLAMRPLPGVRVTLISDSGMTPYSGMLPGLVAGHYSHEQVHIDLPQLCRWAGVGFIEARVTGLEPVSKVLHLEQQGVVSYEKVSFDTGSTPDVRLPGAGEHVIGVKPVSRFFDKWQQLRAVAEQGRGGHWGVVGAGAGGVELILAMAQRLGAGQCLDAGSTVNWHLVYASDRVLAGYPDRVVAQAEQALAAYGIRCHPNTRVQSVDAGGLTAADGTRLPLDEIIWCTSAQAPDWPGASGLATANGGFIAVNEYLQSTSHPDVFAAGDVAEMMASPRPKAGVYAVRQAPFLYHNLARAFAGTPLRPVRLQQGFLSLISLGAQRAVGNKGPLAFAGAWVWRWKDWIDRKFMAKLQVQGHAAGMSAGHEGAPMPCAGCGSKLGPEQLRKALSELPLRPHPQLRPALTRSEDAAIWRQAQGPAQVQSIDGFRAFSDDFYRLGQVAVLHSLSDLYAMGAKPLWAQVWMNLAFAHPRLQQRDAQRLMAGVALALYDEGVSLAGGHSTQGAETHLGVVVQGELEGGAWLKQGGQAGDLLVLTKPLGSGVIWAAAMQNRAPARAIQAAWQVMLQSNRPAMEALQAVGAHGVTDVTGFGLLGHCLEMLEGTALRAELWLHQLPAIDGALSLLAAGFQSSLVPHLSPALLQCEPVADMQDSRVQLLLDPQTSGGLLVALPPDAWPALQALIPGASVVGRLHSRADNQKMIALDVTP
ncbi:MAG: selenide, water dikinase SelD [Marinobacter sp.]|nr:selenide, water dikinase SelD [Marinobacter sp.]